MAITPYAITYHRLRHYYHCHWLSLVNIVWSLVITAPLLIVIGQLIRILVGHWLRRKGCCWLLAAIVIMVVTLVATLATYIEYWLLAITTLAITLLRYYWRH